MFDCAMITGMSLFLLFSVKCKNTVIMMLSLTGDEAVMQF